MNLEIKIEEGILRAVTFKEGDWFVAQCLERDIASQAKTEEAVEAEIRRVVLGHEVISREIGERPFVNIPPAPKRFWDMYQQESS